MILVFNTIPTNITIVNMILPCDVISRNIILVSRLILNDQITVS